MARRKIIIDGVEVEVEVVQPTAADLKATVTPSGDMARKAYYDRNATPILKYYFATLGSHNWTERWKYTVPNGKKAIHGIFFELVYQAIATSGAIGLICHSINATTFYNRFAQVTHVHGGGFETSQTRTATFLLDEGDYITSSTLCNDSVNHDFTTSSLLTEFDA